MVFFGGKPREPLSLRPTPTGKLLHLLDKRTDLNAAVLDRFREELKFTHAAKLSDIEMSEEVLEQIGFFV